MKIAFDANAPIYAQIVEAFKRRLASGEIQPGAKIPPVRELALELGVNPNTLQRAMAELEREELFYAERTSGRFATEDETRLEALRRDLCEQIVAQYVRDMRAIGYGGEAAAGAVKDYCERIQNDGNTED